MASHDVAQPHLNEVGDGALGLSHTEIHRHGLDAGTFALLMLQHHVAHLGAVAMADNDIIIAL